MQGEIYTCKNGLTVIVNRQTAFPVVSVQVWVGTGAEHEGEHAGAGLSHLIEHMVFKGTSTLDAQQLNEEVADLGGIWNAYTSTDRTVYHIDGPAANCRRFTEILLQLVMSFWLKVSNRRLENPGMPTMPLPSRESNAMSSEFEIPISLSLLLGGFFSIRVPKASGMNVSFI